MKNVEDVLSNFIADKVGALTSALDAAGSNSTSTLRQSIADNYSESAKVTREGFTMEISAASYWEAVNDGRKAGKFPPMASILDWVRSKPTLAPFRDKTGRVLSDRSMAFLIGRKIAKHGTKGNHFVDKSITKRDLKELEKDVAEALKKDAVSQFKLALKIKEWQ